MLSLSPGRWVVLCLKKCSARWMQPNQPVRLAAGQCCNNLFTAVSSDSDSFSPTYCCCAQHTFCHYTMTHLTEKNNRSHFNWKIAVCEQGLTNRIVGFFSYTNRNYNAVAVVNRPWHRDVLDLKMTSTITMLDLSSLQPVADPEICPGGREEADDSRNLWRGTAAIFFWLVLTLFCT